MTSASCSLMKSTLPSLKMVCSASKHDSSSSGSKDFGDEASRCRLLSLVTGDRNMSGAADARFGIGLSLKGVDACAPSNSKELASSSSPSSSSGIGAVGLRHRFCTEAGMFIAFKVLCGRTGHVTCV